MATPGIKTPCVCCGPGAKTASGLYGAVMRGGHRRLPSSIGGMRSGSGHRCMGHQRGRPDAPPQFRSRSPVSPSVWLAIQGDVANSERWIPLPRFAALLFRSMVRGITRVGRGALLDGCSPVGDSGRTLIEAFASMKTFKPKADSGGGLPAGCGAMPSATSTASCAATRPTPRPPIPLPRPLRKGCGKEAKLCHMGHS
jgi:hypothetical protein